ncbi:MAG: GNAT family protein [Bacillota bacterium]
MNNAPEIRGQRILLRQPLEKDIADRFICGRTAEIVRMYGGDTRNLKPFTQEDVKHWFERINSQPLEWVIEYENKCIGNARLSVDVINRRARYAIGIFDISKLGLGIGTETTRLILDYAFRTLKLHRVDLVVLDYNKRAIACYAKCGFTIEGRERENALIEDKWETDVHMSILESEYCRSAGSKNNSEYRREVHDRPPVDGDDAADLPVARLLAAFLGNKFWRCQHCCGIFGCR